MNRLKPVSAIGVVVASLWLSACGGGSSSPLNPNTPVEPDAMDTTSPVYIGNGYGDSFQEGVIRTTVGDNVLSPGGSTNLTINIVSGTKDLAASSVKIALNSPCLASGEASLSTTAGVALTNNELTSTSGEVTAIYKANGCVGRDIVSATATLQGIAKVATAAIDIESDTVMTLESLAPVPSRISLKGAGGKESAQVSFIVRGPTGAPIKDVEIQFQLGSLKNGKNIGDATLQTISAISDKSGKVTAIVNSGHIATALAVTAKAVGPNISTTSSGLIISTGIPDQDSMSIAATNPYPVGWDYFGEKIEIVTRLADAFNNPVADDTPVSFTTEGGAIESSCFTKDGSCTVTWTSQNPLPVRNSLNNDYARKLCVNSQTGAYVDDLDSCRKERAGRATILARAVGDESFLDVNNNGLYDYGVDIFKTKTSYVADYETKKSNGAKDEELSEEFNAINECNKNFPLSSSRRQPNSPPACDDLAAAYLDTNENELYDMNEQFFSPGEESQFPEGNGIYNGFLCRDNDDKCTNEEKVFIRADLNLIMTSRYMLMDNRGLFPFLPRTVALDPVIKRSSNMSSSSAPTSSRQNQTSSLIWFWLSDINGNGAPAGTTIKIDKSALKNVDAILLTKGPLPGSSEPTLVDIDIFSDDSGNPPGGRLAIEVTFPHSSGDITWTNIVTIEHNAIEQ